MNLFEAFIVAFVFLLLIAEAVNAQNYGEDACFRDRIFGYNASNVWTRANVNTTFYVNSSICLWNSTAVAWQCMNGGWNLSGGSSKSDYYGDFLGNATNGYNAGASWFPLVNKTGNIGLSTYLWSEGYFANNVYALDFVASRNVYAAQMLNATVNTTSPYVYVTQLNATGNVTAPQYCFGNQTNSETCFSSVEVFVKASADLQSQSTTVLSYIPNLYMLLKANSIYEYDCNIVFSTNFSTTGIALALNTNTTFDNISYSAQIPIAADAAAAMWFGWGSASNDTIIGTGVQTANVFYTAKLFGVIDTNANSLNLSVMFRSETVNRTLVTPYSHCRYKSII